ncbi:hypothetical protein GPJ81_17940 [Pseudomonas alkylphenolica]|uniref:Uncharacterized protein n=1 Tax=Pseudomonas alkylphenolica TaxID=237609 RepID=A0A6I6GVG0_9PSED|nr:hypothetical protein [Pseudomonas alkylphenolica]QGW78483.1 hypothetical protein GPJ81_17940 [Pseudomonas alkylphenolica]
MQKQTPKWLELFITAFSAKGLVALAWWMGALHAERIRGLQRSYPFLAVTGDADSGNTTLLQILWKLLGSEDPVSISPAHIGRMRHANHAVNWPVVIEDIGRSKYQFDWDQLKTCYNGDTIIRARSGQDDHKFQGALVIVGNPQLSEAMCSRFVFVRLDRTLNSERSRQAQEELLALPVDQFTDFKTQATRADDQVLHKLNQLTQRYIDLLQEESEGAIKSRAALNHAQLMSLIDALQDLYLIPPGQEVLALARVLCMAEETYTPS